MLKRKEYRRSQKLQSRYGPSQFRPWILRLVVWLPSIGALAGCLYSLEAQPPVQSTVEDCESTQIFELHLRDFFTSPLDVAPMEVKVLTDSIFIALDQQRRIHRFGRGRDASFAQSFQLFKGLAQDHKGILAFTNEAVFRLDEDMETWHELQFEEEITYLTLLGANSNNELWLVDDHEESGVIHRMEPRDSTYMMYRTMVTWEIPGDWQLSAIAPERAFVISRRFPFEMAGLFGTGEIHWLGSLASSFDSVSDSTSVYVSGIVRLDCNRLLITLSDLRSSERRLFIVDSDSGALVSQGDLDSTMGFFGSEPRRRRGFAFRSTREGGEVLIYRWTWRK